MLYVELGGVSERPRTAIDAMAEVITSFDPEARKPTAEREAVTGFRAALDGKRVLLLLDNAKDAGTVAPLFEHCPPGCAVLVTSREKIVWPGVAPVPLEEMTPGEARKLLRAIVGQARATDVELDAIARHCGRLPLALRVAGTFLARHTNWPVEDYLKALADERGRLAKLKLKGLPKLDVTAVLGFSARQLAGEDRGLAERWQALAVFVESFDLAAAAAVWDVSADEALAGLGELVARSMVRFDPETSRYRLHDLMRDVARLPLEGADTAAVEQRLAKAAARHADHYCTVLRTADDLYQEGNQNTLAGLALYDLEQLNIATGQAWAVKRMDVDEGAAKLAAQYALWGFQVLGLRLHPRQRIAWLDVQLRVCRRYGYRLGEGWALGGLGRSYHRLGDAQRALEYHEQHLKIARRSKHRRSESDALDGMGIAYRELGKLRRAIECHEQSLVIARELSDRRLEGHFLGSLGIAYEYNDETRRAIECHEKQLEIAQGTRDRQREARALCNLANAYHRLVEARRAIEYYDQSLPIARELGDRQGEATTLGNLGAAWSDLGEPRRAIGYFDRHLAIAREIGDQRGEGRALYNWAEALERLGANAEALEKGQAALAIFEQIEHPNAAKARELVERLRGGC